MLGEKTGLIRLEIFEPLAYPTMVVSRPALSGFFDGLAVLDGAELCRVPCNGK
jgi:hypothetical protein